MLRLAFAILPLLVGVPLVAQRSGSPPPQAKTITQIATEVGPAVVTIVTHDKDGKPAFQGTGFVVRADGVVVTNWHVMAGAVSATVTLKTGENYNRVSFLDGDKDGDIAILKIPGFGLPVVDVVADIPTVGSKIVTVSSPLGLDQTVTEGIVSAVRILDGRQLVQITAPISHGSSGGPVIDSAGKVFAISTLTLEEGQGLNFAVPVKYAMGLIASSVTPRELSDVFAKDSNTDASNRPASTSARPKRTEKAIQSLVGTYMVSFDKIPAAVMVVAADDVGLVAVINTQAITVNRLDGIRTNTAGDVVVSVGGVTSRGYQTGDGFWATGTGPAKDTNGVETPFAYEAVRVPAPIDRESGVYQIQCRVSGQAGAVQDSAGDWQGQAAVITTYDAIYLDMRLRNAQGGSSGLFASGPIKSGMFDLQSGGQRLAGSIRGGSITGQWTDRRATGTTFLGNLTGERK